MGAESFYGGSSLWAYLLVALVVLAVVRAALRAVRGTPIREGLLLGMPIVLVGLYALDVFGTFFAGYLSTYASITIVGTVAEGLAVAVGAFVALHFTGRTLVIDQRPPTPSGRWYYRIGPAIPIAYLVLFVLRVAIESVVAGVVPFTVPDTLNGLSPTAVYALTVVDVLWGFTSGLYLGRNVVVLRRWRRREADAALPLSTA